MNGEGRKEGSKEGGRKEGKEETHLMYMTSSCGFADGQLSVLQVTPVVPWTFQPMLLRVWKVTFQADVVAAKESAVV